MIVDNVLISAACPFCEFENDFTVKQVRLRDVIICRGCKHNIQLEDHMNQCRKVVRGIDRQLRELENSMGNFNITI